ncbi:hypothetical protein CQK57_19050 [Salmonella enterica]|uniref:hypothetical protein n=1 Tax=Salmonella enterica TaxID=28901 RepID=UPI0009B135F9|nr:hypothetical protein [Salmonella enterica]EBG8069925.1 hypothetical protein [Salmonella enterica subsp. enterica serovar Elisabethville]EED8014500.1 hypothetical protein [Salmonella enterica subsp. enterica]EAA8604915.1 hypothetical protein [Salmonella enterica]EBH3514038.1 hypothetical protein [Salmonella enterica subsp. enterica serovar Elisabethville]EBH6159946.1 hypothetical protein [Salmonella enterica]
MKKLPLPALALLAFSSAPAIADSDWGYASGEYYYTINRNSVFSMDNTPGYEYIQVKTNERNKKVCQTPENNSVALTLNKQQVQGERHIWQKKGECQISLIIRGKPTQQWLVNYLSERGHVVTLSDITGDFKISGRGFKHFWDASQ